MVVDVLHSCNRGSHLLLHSWLGISFRINGEDDVTKFYISFVLIFVTAYIDYISAEIF